MRRVRSPTVPPPAVRSCRTTTRARRERMRPVPTCLSPWASRRGPDRQPRPAPAWRREPGPLRVRESRRVRPR
ncbi:3-oxoadipate enol-lactone hydrolase, partial [Clavibacter michiganensis subsp. michiganensis]|nr:3-oxoadipate enol-lactone hydrolase [Clavibacter michiganensis subsp. michiganensis]